jgi:hypothetical protein
LAYQIRSLSGYEALSPLTTWHVLALEGRQEDAPALGAASVTHLLSDADQVQNNPAFHLTVDGPVRILENAAALPRARFVTQYAPATNRDDAVRLMAQMNSLPVIETSRRPMPGGGNSEIKILSDSPSEVKLSTHVEACGFLLLADTFYPGWRVYVNGQPREIQRANACERAVWLEPGTHDVLFRYEPLSIRIGVAITSIGLVICLALWSAPVWRRQPSRPPA